VKGGITNYESNGEVSFGKVCLWNGVMDALRAARDVILRRPLKQSTKIAWISCFSE
jgi:hypothetical protein